MSYPLSRSSSSTGANNDPPEPDPTAPSEKERLFSLSPAQVLGGALAAMTAAALGSRLGVAGTIVGAALASVIAAVGGSLYTASIRASQQRVATVLSRTRSQRPSTPRTITQEFSQPAAEVAEEKRGARKGWWKGAVVGAVAAFAIAAVALTSFELFTGNAISGGDGTTITQVGRDASGGSGADSSTPSATTTETVTESAAPAESASASSAPPATPADSATPSTTPSATPSVSPSASSTPSSPETASATPSSGSDSTTEARSGTTADGVSNP